jgi:glc operon protein GlcG
MRISIAFAVALAAIVLLGQRVAAQPPGKKVLLLDKKVLSLEAARKMVEAAETEAERNHWRGVIAVVDDGGWLIVPNAWTMQR